jgi:hypothetical protein
MNSETYTNGGDAPMHTLSHGKRTEFVDENGDSLYGSKATIIS